MYTTRPIRDGERDGVEYYFTNQKKLEELSQAGKVIELRTYETALVYQTVGFLEDRYDFEGMMEAGNRHNELAQKLRASAQERFVQEDGIELLHLGAGGCRVCVAC